jgi:hypothetical protein
MATTNFSIIIGDTEYYVRYPLGFNPFDNLAAPRIIKQKTIAGTNYQQSDIRHSDGRFVISGQWLDETLQAALATEYEKAASAKSTIRFKNNLTGEIWQVLIASFVPFPQNMIYRQAQIWSLELWVVGKYVDGKLVT